MKLTKQETVMFSKGRCCFVRFECEGTSDRALLREGDAIDLVNRWDSAPDMYQALKAAEWGGNRSERVCPVCRRLDFEEHRKDCLLANALAKADGKPTLSPAPDQPASRREP